MKFCVIGLGRFGYQVATTLAENNMEVVGVDSNESIIASIRDDITQAVCMRINDEDDLRSIAVDEIDTVIVAMGENFAQSILVTALLKQKLKVNKVITRSIDKIHKDILQLIGADKVILPEQEVGQRLAETLSLPFKYIVKVAANFSISQIQIPYYFDQKTIAELELTRKYNIKCIGLKVNENEIISIDDNYVVSQGDILIISGNNSDLAQALKI